ncbi:unnamed protein product [Camellia sinensis]
MEPTDAKRVMRESARRFRRRKQAHLTELETQVNTAQEFATSDRRTVIYSSNMKLLYSNASDPADNDAWKDKGTGQLAIKCKEGVNKE